LGGGKGLFGLGFAGGLGADGKGFPALLFFARWGGGFGGRGCWGAGLRGDCGGLVGGDWRCFEGELEALNEGVA